MLGAGTAIQPTPSMTRFPATMLGVNENSNVKQTIGWTINQGANDDEILAFKSSDVAHGCTGQTETDTYGLFKKTSADNGGLTIDSYIEDVATTNSLALRAFGGTADTTKSTAGRGLLELYAYEISGTSVANITADGNVFAVRGRVGGSTIALMILDEDGDLWINGGITTTGAGTGGSGSAGAGSQYVALNIAGTTYKLLHDGTV